MPAIASPGSRDSPAAQPAPTGATDVESSAARRYASYCQPRLSRQPCGAASAYGCSTRSWLVPFPRLVVTGASSGWLAIAGIFSRRHAPQDHDVSEDAPSAIYSLGDLVPGGVQCASV